METRIGEDGLGAFARQQIEAHRNDPRLGRGRGAMIADFWNAIEEAERVRGLGILGLHELTSTLKRKEDELGVSRDDPSLSGDTARILQAHWERSESALIEIGHGYPHLNAQALISMNSALDALVEELVPAMRAMRVKLLTEQFLVRTEQQRPEAAASLTPETRERLGERLAAGLAERLPKLEHLAGGGIERYEVLLRQEGLGAPDDRPIPTDLNQALTELGALRNVLTHRAGRVDDKALRQAPSLRYEEGQLIRIKREEYRMYSAALRCYAAEITYRPIRNWPQASDEQHGPNLDHWRSHCYVTA